MKKVIPRQRGFTLIELMIATAVFSVVLLICLAAFVQVGRMYYRGVTNAKLQQVTRSALEDITQNIQFSSGAINTSDLYLDDNPSVFCINDKRYILYRGLELTSNANPSATQSRHVLQRESGYSASNCPDIVTQPVGSEAVELLSEGMQVQRLEISLVDGSSGTYNVGLRVVFADSSPGTGLLENNPNVSVVSDQSSAATNSRCAAVSGSQFCSDNELATTITQRK